MTTTEQITVTADGVTYVRGEKLDPFKQAIPEVYFEGGFLCRKDKRLVDNRWGSNLIDVYELYAAIPQQEREWVEVQLIKAELVQCPSYGAGAVAIQYSQEEYIKKAVSRCLKADAVKIDWQSGEVKFRKSDGGWLAASIAYYKPSFEAQLTTAFLAGYRVWVKEGGK